MPLPCSIEAHDQKCRADDHVEAVKPGRHKKRRRVDAAGKAERGVAVFVSLDRGKAKAEEDRQRQAAQQSLAVAVDQGVMCPGHGRSRQQEDQRIQKREFEGVERMDGLGRPNAADRKQARGKERPEKGGEEHHLGGDEQGHAVAHPELHDRGVVTLKRRFANDVAPPHRHDRQHREDPDDQQGPAVAVHVENAARRQKAGSEGAKDRPRAGIDQMIGMLGRGVRLAHGCGPGSLSSRKVLAVAASMQQSGAQRNAPGTSCRTA